MLALADRFHNHRLQRVRPQRSRPFPLPSPEGGLNSKDALDQMPIADAIQLDNWFPNFGKVTIRRGYSAFATGLGSGNVDTLSDYQAGALRKLLAGANGNIYDVTAGSPASLASGFANNRWQTSILDGAQGWVNGTDAPQVYDGTTVGAMTVSGTGLTPSNLIGIHTFKNRTYFWETNSPNFWYSTLSTMGGVLTEFVLGQVSGLGGRLVNVVSWSRDGGDGPDDLIAFVMSSGAVAVYQGIDPGADFSIVGVFHVGEPVNIRASTKLGGDAVIVTRDGYAPLSRALSSGRTAPGYKVGDKIVSAAINQIKESGGDFGWQAVHYPEGRYLLINHPTSSGNIFNQHVVNLETGSWCRFKGQNARCWSHHKNKIYFGTGNGEVMLADTGTSDNGANILAEARQAFTWCNARGTRKALEAVRVMLESDGVIPVELDVQTDFSQVLRSVTPVEIGTSNGAALWDSAIWDVSSWGDLPKPKIATMVRGRIGDSFGLRMRITTQGQQVSWTGSHLIWQQAGMT